MIMTGSGKKVLQRSLTILISLVWLINGLYCKLLNQIPRHQLIVSRILGDEYAGALTKIIGVSEIIIWTYISWVFLMGCWPMYA
ncbi:MAG: DoxX-like family protein [Chitinophagaceae bacterium]